MRDKVGCTCAVQNGGFIKGNRWYTGGPRGVIRRGEGGREAYYQCLRARGGWPVTDGLWFSDHAL